MDEPLGGKEKFWFIGPDDHRYLFKYARSDDDGTNTRGEDWAEWTVSTLAALIGVPTATTIPARFDGRRGVLSRSVVASHETLVHGNELLARVVADYDAAAGRLNPGYTVTAIQTALAGIEAPPGCNHLVTNAFDGWAGYVLLDAWTAGRDRHHENWAAILHDGQSRLAPSYDHGNALGFQESERKVVALGADNDQLAAWLRRGNSHHFAGKPSLVAVAVEALSRATPSARRYWLDRLLKVQVADVKATIDQVPASLMSEPGRRFRVRLLVHNRERILDECSQLAHLD